MRRCMVRLMGVIMSADKLVSDAEISEATSSEKSEQATVVWRRSIKNHISDDDDDGGKVLFC